MLKKKLLQVYLKPHACSPLYRYPKKRAPGIRPGLAL